MKGIILAFFLFFFLVSTRGQDNSGTDSTKNPTFPINSGQANSKTKTFSFITNLPKDYSDFCKREFRKQQLPKYAAIAVSTGLLILADQAILDGTQQFGNNINVSGDDRMKALFEVTIKTKSKPISLPFYVPTDANSTMYYIGDGAIHFGLCFGFWTYGKIAKDSRAARTGIQVMESMIASGIVIQVIKHVTGRESPFTTDVPRGVWRFFPNQTDYANHVPRYDAFPTGHLATAVSTVTVIAENYPEWRMVKPIGYGLCGLLAFSMVNNGVHWASDYPLGIALGYSFAKIVTDRNKDQPTAEKSTASSSRNLLGKPLILPATFGKGSLGMTSIWSF
jgi:membrane-associated phospholipid phosphatase